MLNFYRLILKMLSRREKFQFFGMLTLIFFMAVFSATSVISILPFLQILTDPSTIQTNMATAWLYEWGGFEDNQAFFRFFGLIVFVITVTGIAFRFAMVFILRRYALMLGYSMSSRLLARYLNQPYIWFVSRKTSDISFSVLSEVDLVVNRGILPALKFFPSLVTVVLLVGFLCLLEPTIAVIAIFTLGTAYGISFMVSRRFLRKLGLARKLANQRRFRAVQEATGGVKELKLMGLEKPYLSVFKAAAMRMARASVRTQILTETPRFILEFIVYGGLIMIILVMIGRGEEFTAMIPTLGTMAVAGNRLLPALQAFYNQAASIRTNMPALEAVQADLFSLQKTHAKSNAIREGTGVAEFRKTLTLEAVSYTYPGAERPAIDTMDLTIAAGETVGIVGGTGAGKTTLVDLILGLLSPDTGRILIDGQPLTDNNLNNWQRSLGYVPQHIFLTDDTVARNIAFGHKNTAPDMERVISAARAAMLHDFIETELPDGYRTKIGDNGLRLSGGQRQRIGIARALYSNPDMVLLDEASSALDNLTEEAVMEAVHGLAGEKTILMIAHRLSTVVDCDRILFMQQGRIVASGRYDELIETNQDFRKLARA